MSDAQSAIVDIQEALAEYGSTVTFRSVTQGVYTPLTGNAETNTDTVTKAFIKQFATKELSDSIKDNVAVNSYELAAMFYITGTVKLNDKIIIGGVVYNIIYISPLYFQDIIVKYEVLIKK